MPEKINRSSIIAITPKNFLRTFFTGIFFLACFSVYALPGRGSIHCRFNFPGAPKSGLDHVTFSMTIEKMPSTEGHFYSNSMWLTNGIGLYVGLQPHPQHHNSIAYSIFVGKDSGLVRPINGVGHNGADGGTAIGGGIGYPFVEGRTYLLDVAIITDSSILKPGEEGLQAWVTDTKTNQITPIGIYAIPATWGKISNGCSSWDENYSHYDESYTRGVFNMPIGYADGKKYTGAFFACDKRNNIMAATMIDGNSKLIVEAGVNLIPAHWILSNVSTKVGTDMIFDLQLSRASTQNSKTQITTNAVNAPDVANLYDKGQISFDDGKIWIPERTMMEADNYLEVPAGNSNVLIKLPTNKTAILSKPEQVLLNVQEFASGDFTTMGKPDIVTGTLYPAPLPVKTNPVIVK